MNWIRKIVNSDYIFSVISKMLGVVIAVVYSVFYNRYLGASLKGEAAIISNYVSLISSLACLGMYQAYPFYKKKEGTVFYPFVNTMTSVYFLLLLLSVFAFFAFPDTNINFRIALIMVPVQAYIRHINYVVLVETPRRMNISSIVLNIFDLLLIIGFWLFTQASYQHLVYILIIQMSFSLALSYSNLKVDAKQLRFTLKTFFKYAKFGIVPMITLFLMTINYRVDILMLEHAPAVTSKMIGVYSVGIALAEKIWLIPDALKDILLSRLCNGKGDYEVARIIRISLFITLVLVVAVAIISPVFVKYVYGEEFIGAETITTIMLVGVIGMIFYKMVYVYNIANGHRVVSLLFLGIAALLNVFGNWLFVPVGGIYAAAWCSVVSYTICGICFAVYFHHVSKVSYLELLFLKKEDVQAVRSMIFSRKR